MTRPTRNRIAARGALFVLAALLAASGLIRLGQGPAQAVAREFSHLEMPEPAAQPSCAPTDDSALGAILSKLQDRERAVAETEQRQKHDAQTLAVAREEIQDQLHALAEAEESLRSTLALAETAAEDDLSRLTTVYENMKPKDAAALFEQMAPEFAAGFFGRMRPDTAAQIMAALSPASAYSISVILAGRNAGVPSQ
ncbi:MotE family protein [Actibacterium sp.]|uniref:MotE family protein n=1 Tax=Actibacterium sp. TaxID=1872125 RepID=UPI00356405EF